MEQKLLVFVSSLIDELKSARKRIKNTIESFGLCDAWLFESTPASSEDFERYFLEGVKDCDIFVQILDRELSPPVRKELEIALLHEKPVLVFVRRNAKRSKDFADFVSQIKKQRIKYAEFSSIAQLLALLQESLFGEIVSKYRKQLSQKDYTALFETFRSSITQASVDQDPKISRAANAALAELGTVGDKGAVDTLVKNLKNINASTRWMAAEALGETNSPAAIDPLINALMDINGFVRAAAATSLGSLKSTAAINPLLEMLTQDVDVNARRAAAGALGQIGNPKAARPLTRALDDNDKGVRLKAATSLLQLGQTSIEPLIENVKISAGDWPQEAEKVLGQLGQPAVEPLIRMFKDDNQFAQNAAARAFGYMEDPPVGQLIELLSDDNLSMRVRAAQALSYIGDKKATQPISKLLEDQERGVRWNAAVALCLLRDPQAIDPLIDALADGDPSVATEIAAALVSIGEPAIEPLIQALLNRNSIIRERAALVLGREKLGGAQAIRQLRKCCLNDDDERVRETAKWAVQELRSVLE
jgi:HEAT repeat protein